MSEHPVTPILSLKTLTQASHWLLICLCWGALLSTPLLAANDELHSDSLETPDEDADEAEGWDVNAPPGDWKTIRIESETVTWSNVDVSPDGKTLVFDALGDLYTMPIEGGQATALTADIAWNFQPRFSPDGRSIAYISDAGGADNIWIMNADGSEPAAVTEERNNLLHNVSWSPDGNWLVARRGYVSQRSIPAGEIWMFHRSGGKGIQLVSNPHGKQGQKNIAEPVFSHDGRYVYYSQDVTSGTVWQYNKDATGQIFVIQRLDRERGETVTVAGGPGGAIRPVPSPDGKSLAYLRRLPTLDSAIVIQDLASGNERIVYSQFERDMQETSGAHGNAPAFAWTPDSNRLVFWTAGTFHSLDVDSKALTDIPMSLDISKQVRDTVRFDVDVWKDEFPVQMIRFAKQSPDGSRVVFHALGHLYIRDTEGGEATRLTRQDEDFEFWPSWSADGKSIIYTTWNDQTLGSVRIVPARGGSGKIVTEHPGHYVEPVFSADGKRIAYRKFSGGYLLSPLWSGETGLYVADRDGSNAVKVSSQGQSPMFSADGKRLMFMASGEESAALLNSVNLDGFDPITHLNLAGATSMSVSPDGQWVAFTEQYNAYVAPVAMAGQTVSVGKGGGNLPVTQISSRSGESLHFSGDSQSVHWSHGPILYSRALTDAFAFLEGSPEELPEPVSEGIDLSFVAKADKPDSVIAIKAARIVTMRDAQRFEEVIQDGVIVVEGNRIVAVGPQSEVEIPDSAQVLDAGDRTIIPGLVDVHAHGGMGSNEITPQQNWMQYSNLSFGVTSIHDPSNDSTEIFSHAELQRTGQVVGPRTWSTGTILYGALAKGYTAEVNSYDDAVFHLQRLKDLGAISVKSYNHLQRDVRQQIIEAGSELGVMVVPEGGMKFQHNMTHIVDGHTGVEHALPIAHIYDDVVQLWSQTDTGYTPTFGVAYGGLTGETYWYDRTEVWKNERLMRYSPKAFVYPAAMRRTTAPDEHYNHFNVSRHARTLRDKGVRVLIGAHGQREGLAAHWEIWMLEQGGMTPWQALRAATIDGAWYLGMDASVGSLEPGKLADLAIIDGNPLTDIRRSEYISHTMINGRLYEVSSMNEVLSGDRQRQPFYFETEGGDSFPSEAASQLEAKAERYHWTHH